MVSPEMQAKMLRKKKAPQEPVDPQYVAGPPVQSAPQPGMVGAPEASPLAGFDFDRARKQQSRARVLGRDQALHASATEGPLSNAAIAGREARHSAEDNMVDLSRAQRAGGMGPATMIDDDARQKLAARVVTQNAIQRSQQAQQVGEAAVGAARPQDELNALSYGPRMREAGAVGAESANKLTGAKTDALATDTEFDRNSADYRLAQMREAARVAPDLANLQVQGEQAKLPTDGSYIKEKQNLELDLLRNNVRNTTADAGDEAQFKRLQNRVGIAEGQRRIQSVGSEAPDTIASNTVAGLDQLADSFSYGRDEEPRAQFASQIDTLAAQVPRMSPDAKIMLRASLATLAQKVDSTASRVMRAGPVGAIGYGLTGATNFRLPSGASEVAKAREQTDRIRAIIQRIDQELDQSRLDTTPLPQ